MNPPSTFISEKTRRSPFTAACFSPAVMVGTFTIELFLVAYVTYRFGLKSLFNKLTVFLLFLLSVFQIAEFQICSGFTQEVWGRIGFIATALMPPIGLHMVSILTQKKVHAYLAYIISVLFVGFFALVPGSISGALCGGNYVMFSTTYPSFHIAFGVYYALFLLWGLMAAHFSRKDIGTSESSTLRWIAIGYTSFMLPAALSYILFPSSRGGFASILCGFAILMALILTFMVIPRYAKIDNQKL